MKELSSVASYFRTYLPGESRRLYLSSLSIGFFWFLAEASFLLVIQGFLASFGLIRRENLFLPAWYPTSAVENIAIFLLFGFARSAVFFVRDFIGNMSAHVFAVTQRKRLFDWLMSAPSTSVNEIALLNGESVLRGAFIYYYSNLLLNTCAVFVFLTAFGLVIAPAELIGGVILFGLLAVPLSFMNRKISVMGEGILQSTSRFSSLLIDSYRNFILIRLYDLKSAAGSSAAELLQEQFRQQRRFQGFSSLRTTMPLALGTVVICAILLGSLWWRGTLDTKLVGLIYLLVRIAQAGSEASSLISQIRVYAPHLDRLRHVLDRKPESQVVNEGKYRPSEVRSIEIAKLTLRAPDGGRVLQEGISLTLHQGDILLLRGPSGSGKSTLILHLVGALPASKGAIRINEIDVEDVDLSQSVAFVGPEPYLLPGTLRENILFGVHREVRADEIHQLLSRFGLSELVPALDVSYGDQPPLSTGQKQRIAIIRALLRWPSLLLLDEASANLDVENELKLQEWIRENSSRMITVVVTHRGSYDAMATQAIAFEEVAPDRDSKTFQ